MGETKDIQFLGHFFGCEKLATAIVGIKGNCPVDDVFCRGFKLKLSKVISAAKELKLNVSDDHLTALFEDDDQWLPFGRPPPDENRLSARQLRNRMVHHFGPSIVGLIIERWDFFAPKMTDFLACDEQVFRYLEKKWR